MNIRFDTTIVLDRLTNNMQMGNIAIGFIIEDTNKYLLALAKGVN